MMKQILLATLLIIVFLFVYTRYNNIYWYTETKELTVHDYHIEVKIKDCLTCLWLDPDYKKTVYIAYQNQKKKFKLESATLEKKTRVILGVSKVNSKFRKENISNVIVFPNELEKLETFDFDTCDDLNKKDGGDFIRINYYSDEQVNKVKSELEILFDTVVF